MSKEELLRKQVETDSSLVKYDDAFLSNMFWGEVEEYKEAYNESLIGQDPYELAQEGADVLRIALEIKRRGVVTKVVEQAVVGVLRDFNATGIN